MATPKIVLQILHVLLLIFVARGKSAPARLEKRESEKISKLLGKKDSSEHDLVIVSALLRNRLKRVSRSEGRSSAR